MSSKFRVQSSKFALIFGFVLPQLAFAHARSTSYSTWEIAGNRAQVTVRISVIEFQRLGLSLAFPSAEPRPWNDETEQAIAAYLTRNFRLYSDGQLCEPVLPGVRIVSTSDLTRVVRAWTLVCPSSQRLQLRTDAFFATAPAHLHFARVQIAGGLIREKVLSVQESEWLLFDPGTTTAETGSRFRDYLWLGITHIVSGADHLVFLLALLLMAESLGYALRIVTGFTVAHSITLGLGVLNVVRPSSAAVESFIGFSIGIVALENFWLTTGEDTRRWLLRWFVITVIGSVAAAGCGVLQVPLLALVGISLFATAYLLLLDEHAALRHLRWIVACVFGLVHGFGFAGTLTDLALPTNRLATALLGFNLGVELGQLGLMVAVWPLLMRLSQLHEQRTRILIIQAGSAAILSAGIFWFVTRAVG